MNKTVKILIGIVLIILLLFVLKYFKDSNSKEVVDYNTEIPFYTSIVKKAVATGKLNPEEELAKILAVREEILPLLAETRFWLNEQIASGKKVLFEGAQAHHLDIA